MCRLIESIKLHDGKFFNLFYHEQRMKSARSALFGQEESPDLARYLENQRYPREGLWKCRVLYDREERQVTFTPYEARPIRRVKVVVDDSIAYDFKYENRDAINRLFSLRETCDDVMIIRNNKVTDCSFSNIAFRKGAEWFTPQSPLLQGTMRQKLLDERRIRPMDIHQGDIRAFETFRIINAMLEFESPEIEVSQIVF